MNLKIFEKFLSLFKNINQRNRNLLLGGILLFAFLLDYFVLMHPQIIALTTMNPKIKTLSEDIQRAQNDIQNINRFLEEVIQLRKKLEEINARVRSKEEIPMILERIALLANQYGIKIDSMMPDPQQQEVLLQDSERIYYSLPISVEAGSNYHNLGRFLNAIDQDQVFISLENFSIKTTADITRHALKLTFKAVIFENNPNKTEAR